MSPLKHRMKSRVILPAISFLLVISIMNIILVDVSMARPPQKILPKPFVLNRGDGDTINGRYITYDMTDNETLLYPMGPQMTVMGGTDSSIDQKNEHFVKIKWIILYRLIK